jgi:hypothetical protein
MKSMVHFLKVFYSIKFFFFVVINMAVPFSNTKLRVPHGFEGLLEGLVREILLMQPNDIYGFAAVYFENLLGMREGGLLLFGIDFKGI